METKLVVSDLDGCIVPLRGKEYDFQAIEKIRHFSRASKGGYAPELTIATGRSSAFAESVNYMLEIRSTMICESGLVLYHPYSNLSEITLSNQQKSLMKKVRKLTDTWLESNRRVLMDRSKIVMITLLDLVTKKKFEKEIIDYLSKEIDINELDVIHSNMALDIIPKGVDKGSSLYYLTCEKGISSGEVAVIGDSLNDLPMIGVSGYACAPANAEKLIRSKVDYVSEYNYCTGVADILQHLNGGLK